MLLEFIEVLGEILRVAFGDILSREVLKKQVSTPGNLVNCVNCEVLCVWFGEILELLLIVLDVLRIWLWGTSSSTLKLLS